MLEQKRGTRRVRIHVGVDLGSTTTKAVLLDEPGVVVGRGITNSRSNYEVASPGGAAGGPGHRAVQPAARCPGRRSRAGGGGEGLRAAARAHLPARAVPRSAAAAGRRAPPLGRSGPAPASAPTSCTRSSTGSPARWMRAPTPLRPAGGAQERLLPRSGGRPTTWSWPSAGPRPTGSTSRRSAGSSTRRSCGWRTRPRRPRWRISSARRWMPCWPPRARATAAASRTWRGPWRWRAPADSRRPRRWAPATAASACRSPRSRSAARSSATGWARTSCSRGRARCWTSAGRTPRRSRWTIAASSRASR